MSRIELLDPAQAEGETQSMLQSIEKKVGFVPNVLRALAVSPVALAMYQNNAAALRRGELNQRLREQIALAVGQINDCRYCVAAHSAIAKRLRIDEEEIGRNLKAESADPKAHAALQFARRIVAAGGRVSDEDLQAVREAGFTDRQIVEVVAIVSHNIFTNLINHVADTELDYPAPAGESGQAA